MFKFLKIFFASECYWSNEFQKLVKQKRPDQQTLSAICKTLNIKEYSFPNLLGDRDDYKKFIILSQARSGSTLLVKLLQFHPNIVCFNEIFQREICGFDYHFFPEEKDKDLLFLRNSNPSRFFQHFIFRKYMDHISAVGFKIFYGRETSRKVSGVWKLLKNYPDLHIIHIIRKNYFKAFISLKQAVKTNAWIEYDPSYLYKLKESGITDLLSNNENPQKTENNSGLKFEFNEVLEYFQKTDDNIHEFTRYFSGHPYTEIFYEEFENDYISTIEKINLFLGVRKIELFSPIVKQNRNKMSETVINYFELKDKFSKTKWAAFFKE